VAPILIASLGVAGSSQSVPAWRSVGPSADGQVLASRAGTLDRISPAGQLGLWVTAGRGGCWITGDGGRSWYASSPFPLGAAVASVSFLDGKTGWAAGDYAGKGFLAKTSDGGKSWSFRHIVAEPGLSGFGDVQFFDRNFGIAVGGGEFDNGAKMLFASTRDGGVTWSVQSMATDDPGAVFLRRVRFQSRSAIWAEGGQSVFSSRDGGNTWRLVHREHDAVELNGLAVVPDSGIFVAGSWGLVLKSRDFGTTWERLKLPGDAEQRFFWSVSFADSMRGWVVGQDGTILGTRDGGATWAHELSGTHVFLYDVLAARGQVYAVGENLTIIRRE